MLTVIFTMLVLLFGYHDAADTRQRLLKEKELELIKITSVLDQKIPYAIKAALADKEIQNLEHGEQVKRFYPILQPILYDVGQIFPGYGLGYGGKLRLAVYPPKPEILAMPLQEAAQQMFTTKQMVVTLKPKTDLWDGTPVLTVLYPHVKNGEVVWFSWANTKVADLEKSYMAALWHDVPGFFLIWLIFMLILRYSYKCIDQELQGFNTCLKAYATGSGLQAATFSEMAATLDTVRELREELQIKAREIEESEQRFYNCLNNMQDTFVLLKAVRDSVGNIIDFRFEFVNDAACQVNRKTREEFIGKRMLTVWPASRTRLKMYCQVVETGEPLSLEGHHYSDDFNRCLASVYERQVIKLGDGVAISSRNITGRKRMEQQLRQSNERLKMILDQCPVGIVVVDKSGIIEMINEVLLAIVPGRTWRDCVGHSYFDMIAGRGHTRETSPIQRALEGKATVNQRVHRMGREWIVNVTPMYLGGQITGAIGVYQDVTETVKKEHDRLEALARFEQMFKQNPVSMSIIREADGRFIDVNPAWERLFGFTREEAIGRTAGDLQLVRQQAAGIETFWSTLTTEGAAQQEINLWCKDGQSRCIMCSANLTLINEEKHIMGAMFDVTDLRRLEHEMAHFDRLNIVGEMAAGIGHEVRNPMTTVRGYLQLFRGKGEFLKYQADFDAMIEELDRANTIITEYLSLAKDKRMDIKPGNINDVLSLLFPLLQADAFRSGHFIQLETKVVPDIAFDSNEVRQLLLNLVRNGLEAMPDGGTVTIMTCREEDTVILAVQDTGQGIPEHVQQRIGTPFMTTKENGTGLGLAVCYRIVQRHGAKLEFKTGPDGTTFYVKFNKANFNEKKADC
jgi:PAS domain S-box-containing protein